MTDTQTLQSYTGVLTELGGPEMGANAEKPRKVVLKQDRTAQYGKTFRTWHDSLEWNDLETAGVGATFTVDYEIQTRQGGPSGSYTQNWIIGVRQNGAGGGGGEPQPSSGEVGSNAGDPSTTTPTSGNGSWGTPPTAAWADAKTAIATKDDYWEQRALMDEQRNLEMEAAWAVKCVLDRTPQDVELKSSDLVEKSIQVIIVKRQVASEMSA